jgi:hypothetical protein
MTKIDKMRASRQSAHTFFTAYLNLRSRVGQNKLIAILEGREDIPVYDTWISRELFNEVMEPLSVNGKSNAIEISNIIHRSMECKRDKVIICLDYDFDGLSGFAVSEKTYVTSTYSIENLLISEHSMDRVLVRNFDVNGDEYQCRQEVIKLFLDRLNEFNEIMLAPNAHVRFARLIHAPCPGIPNGVEDFVEITLNAVTSLKDFSDSQACVSTLKLGVSPTKEEIETHVSFLRASNLTLSGRGKFLLDFFRRFIALLYTDRKQIKPVVFAASKNSLPDPCQNLLATLASAAPTAPCFRAFLHAQAAQWESGVPT